MSKPDVATLRGWTRPLQAAAILGIAVCAVAFSLAPPQAARACWAAWIFWSGASFGFLALLMLHALTGGLWGQQTGALHRAGARTLPFMGLLLLPLFLVLKDVFPWARNSALFGDDSPHQRAYFQVPGFILRGIGYFTILGSWTLLLGLWKRSVDRPEDAVPPSPAAAGLILYTLLMLFASTDWVVSLEPHWSSTIFLIIFVVDHILAALALIILLLPETHSPAPTVKIWHDLGNLLLAFVMIWTYVSFSQFLIIWSGHLPREISWYRHRITGPWPNVTVLLAVFQFAVPFALLLFRRAKQTPRVLRTIAGLVLGAAMLHTAWLVLPAFAETTAAAALLGLAAFLGMGGVWGLLFLRLLPTGGSAPATLGEVRRA
jgi:hypothetical protein